MHLLPQPIGSPLMQAQRQEQQKAAQAAERAALLARMAEEDRVEQMTAQRRRMRVAEHQREAQRLLDAKRAALEAQQVPAAVNGFGGW
jgi:hypothetical protein